MKVQRPERANVRRSADFRERPILSIAVSGFAPAATARLRRTRSLRPREGGDSGQHPLILEFNHDAARQCASNALRLPSWGFEKAIATRNRDSALTEF
jgi:hypothetical protein